jgi:SAM-dependent methyltransferase
MKPAVKSERDEVQDEGVGDRVVWHDVENGAYSADLPLWERFARAQGAPVLDLGAGTGRVALHLARRGIETIAIDSDAALLATLEARAAAEGLPVRTVAADARDIGDLGINAALAIGPMQLAHLLGGPDGRRRLLEGTLSALVPGGQLHLALLSEDAEAEVGDDLTRSPLPDVREYEGHVYSSLPVAVGWGEDVIQIHRRRELVSPSGEHREEHHMIQLDRLTPDQLEREAQALGWLPRGRTPIPLTADHAGSVVISLEVPR